MDPELGGYKGRIQYFNVAQEMCVHGSLTKGGWGGCQVGWGQFLTMLKYKAEMAGNVYQEVDRFFPSSKACNNCLNVVESLPLEVRQWECQSCGTFHDRDINAAMNIRDEGLRILTCGTRGKAYRQDTSTRGRKKSTLQVSRG